MQVNDSQQQGGNQPRFVDTAYLTCPGCGARACDCDLLLQISFDMSQAGFAVVMR